MLKNNKRGSKLIIYMCNLLRSPTSIEIHTNNSDIKLAYQYNAHLFKLELTRTG